MRTELVYGDRTIEAELPDRTVFPSSGMGTALPAVTDLAAAVRDAVARPLDTPPLRDLVKAGAKVTIAFDDPTVGFYGHIWETGISVALEELECAGVRRTDVRLICANALHRKFTHDELAKIIGSRLVSEFGDRLYCHDAEDRDHIVQIGTTENGLEVELNKAVADDDLTVYLNTGTTRGFGGGWKSVCVGLSTFNTIRYHHNPDDMSMSIDRNRMHDMLNEMGALVSRELGRERIFKIECVQANPIAMHKVFAGTVDACRGAALDIMRAASPPRRSLVSERVDAVVYGVPDWSPYAAYSTTNPLLTLISTGLGYMGGVIEAFGKPGCSVVLATPVPDRWDHQRHPSYKEVWDRVLSDTRDPYEARERYEDEFASREDYVQAYRDRFGFHGVHGIMAIFPLKRLKHAGRVFVAGADDPSLARHVGFHPTATIEEAISEVQAIHGKDASIACVRNPQVRNRR
jgi:hypothetical protein